MLSLINKLASGCRTWFGLITRSCQRTKTKADATKTYLPRRGTAYGLASASSYFQLQATCHDPPCHPRLRTSHTILAPRPPHGTLSFLKPALTFPKPALRYPFTIADTLLLLLICALDFSNSREYLSISQRISQSPTRWYASTSLCSHSPPHSSPSYQKPLLRLATPPTYAHLQHLVVQNTGTVEQIATVWEVVSRCVSQL